MIDKLRLAAMTRTTLMLTGLEAATALALYDALRAAATDLAIHAPTVGPNGLCHGCNAQSRLTAPPVDDVRIVHRSGCGVPHVQAVLAAARQAIEGARR